MRTATYHGWAVPEGWKLVPVEPTSAMTFMGQHVRYPTSNSIGTIWREMLTHAPTPPAKSEVSAETVAWPRDAAEVREFLYSHFCALRYGQEGGEPHDGDRYELTAHDLLSAIEWWADCNSAQTDAQAIRDAARWRFAVEIGGNQAMNWLDVYDDWGGKGDFSDAIDAAMRKGGA